jgi:hypothetical protein
VGCPPGLTEDEVRALAQDTMSKLARRSENESEYLWLAACKAPEVLATFAKAGFTLFSKSIVGPEWD